MSEELQLQLLFILLQEYSMPAELKLWVWDIYFRSSECMGEVNT